MWIVGPQLSNAECDPHCIPHRFTSVGIPLTHGTTKSFFWPEDDVMDIYVDGNGIKLTPDLEHLPRDRWHEVEMEVNLTDDKMLDITGRHGGGAFRLSSPSLSIDEWRSCEGRFCSALAFGTSTASWWAFSCDAAPWCPEFAECSHTTEQQSLEKPRVIWGKRLEHSFDLEVKEDLLFSWLRLEVVLVKGGTAGRRSSCTLKVPRLNVSQTCSAEIDTEMMFDFRSPAVLALGPSPSFLNLTPFFLSPTPTPTARAGGGLWGWIALPVIAIIVCVGILAFVIARRRSENF
ncbi:hypothetical protein C7M84_024662 [Penaeus vannamei]|uniref:Uncharacterized protein n=1 Tax=Penaeus vannamei TaxID=6689 RepID=A0A3R7QXN3_PENVA|nr:hypothetical protein C7M84_024662 [Penaeus vannamei]